MQTLTNRSLLDLSAQKDKGFGRFVRLDATMSMNDVNAVRDNALHRCPTGLTNICEKLVKDADIAIADDADAQKK